MSGNVQQNLITGQDQLNEMKKNNKKGRKRVVSSSTNSDDKKKANVEANDAKKGDGDFELDEEAVKEADASSIGTS